MALSAHHLCMSFRIYIDESGDHSYRGLENLGRRYLGLTAVVFRKSEYDPSIPLELEALKRRHFVFDADYPLVLHRKDIIQRRSHYWVLQDDFRNRAWESELVKFLSECPMQVFTVVVDKKARVEKYGDVNTNPYMLGLVSLLEGLCYWLESQRDGTADVMVESRGNKRDNELLETYARLRTVGLGSYSSEHVRTLYLGDVLLFRNKEHNVAGLQIADILVSEQTRLTVREAGRPLVNSIGPFGQRVNAAIADKVNADGRLLVE